MIKSTFLKFLGLICFLAFFLSPSALYGQNNEPPSPPQRQLCDSSELILRFKNLLLTTGDAVGPHEEIRLFVDDIFRRNTCLRRDIFAVQQKIDAIASGMRGAINTCEIAQFDGYMDEYVKARLELYYLRHLAVPSKEYFDPINRETLKQNMILAYQDLMHPDAIAEYFDELGRLYPDTTAYQKCENPTWKAFIKKLKRLKETVTGLGDYASELQKDFEATYPKDSEKKDLNKDGTSQGKTNWFDRHLGIKLNNKNVAYQDPFTEKGREKLYESLKSGTKKVGSSISDFFNVNELANKVYDEQKEQLTALGEIEVVYFEGSGVIAESFLCNVKTLNDIISKMKDKSKKFKECANLPLQKQCANKPVKEKPEP